MKKVFQKNQMIIMTLAVVIAVAGYVNYSQKYESAGTKNGKTKTVSKNVAKESAAAVTDDVTDVGEAVLTNAQVSNYVAKAKLDREQVHSKAKDTLEEIIKDQTVKDYVSFGRENIQVMGAFGPVMVENKETGEKEVLEKEVNTVKFKQSEDVDGTLITEVKQGKDGVSIKLVDKMKALQWLADHMDIATAEQKAKIEQIRAKTAIMSGTSEEETEDDGFIEALKGEVADVWEEE